MTSGWSVVHPTVSPPRLATSLYLRSIPREITNESAKSRRRWALSYEPCEPSAGLTVIQSVDVINCRRRARLSAPPSVTVLPFVLVTRAVCAFLSNSIRTMSSAIMRIADGPDTHQWVAMSLHLHEGALSIPSCDPLLLHVVRVVANVAISHASLSGTRRCSSGPTARCAYALQQSCRSCKFVTVTHGNSV